MAPVDKPTTRKSTHYPKRLEYILEKGADLPQLSKAQEYLLITLGSFGWRLKRARTRKAAASLLADEMRDRILERLPDSIYGIKVYGKRPVRIRASKLHQEEPINAATFITYLGPHAAEVVTGIRLPLQQLLSDPANYARFVAAILEEFGPEIANEVGVNYNKSTFWDLVHSGALKAPPEDMFHSVPSESRRILVDLLDARGNVEK